MADSDSESLRSPFDGVDAEKEKEEKKKKNADWCERMRSGMNQPMGSPKKDGSTVRGGQSADWWDRWEMMEWNGPSPKKNTGATGRGQGMRHGMDQPMKSPKKSLVR